MGGSGIKMHGIHFTLSVQEDLNGHVRVHQVSTKLLLFVLEDKKRTRGEDVKGCRYCERQRAKSGG